MLMTLTSTPSGWSIGKGVGSTEIVCFLSRTQDVLGGRFKDVTCGGWVLLRKWKCDILVAS